MRQEIKPVTLGCEIEIMYNLVVLMACAVSTTATHEPGGIASADAIHLKNLRDFVCWSNLSKIHWTCLNPFESDRSQGATNDLPLHKFANLKNKPPLRVHRRKPDPGLRKEIRVHIHTFSSNDHPESPLGIYHRKHVIELSPCFLSPPANFNGFGGAKDVCHFQNKL